MEKNSGRTGGRIKNWGRRHKKRILAFLLAYAAVLGIAIAAPSVRAALPREINVGDKAACYVKNEAAADKVVQDIRNYYVVDGARLIGFSSDPAVTVSYANPFTASSETVTEDEATDLIVDKLTGSDSSKVTVKYVVTEKEKFTLDPVYKKDETMLAGEKRVEQDSVDGSKNVTSVVTSVNGEKVSRDVFHEETTKEGTPAIIYKGTLGLPDGESWETYEGDPVYNNADDLVATAYNYIGAPYKHGGTSLKTGVSCVGFVRAIYLKYGIKIGNSHHSMETAGIGVSYSDVRKGDIICYKGHVGLYVGNGKMLDATSSRGVGVNTVHPKSIIAVRRIVQ